MGIRGLKKWALLLTFWVALQNRWVRAADLNGDNLTLTGTTISIGTSTGTLPGLQETYTTVDGTTSQVDFMATHDANIWRWWQKAAGTAQLQLTLDSSGSLTVYDPSTSTAKIVLNPQGTSTFAGNLTLSGTNNQMPNQTLTAASSVLTEGLADGRYLSITGSLVTTATGTGISIYPAGPAMGLNGGIASTYGYAFAEGLGSTATGISSVALGKSTASGHLSTATGTSTATGNYSVAMGRSSASGSVSTAMGRSTASGAYSMAVGVSTASGGSSVAMGHSTASGPVSVAMGHSTATAWYSTAMGDSTATGNYSVAMGAQSTASGYISVAMGLDSRASGSYSIALGSSTASGDGAVALGISTASGIASTATGTSSVASGNASVAMGYAATASGNTSIAMGYTATASGTYSVAIGNQVAAQSYGSTVMGQYNVGGGTSSNSWVPTDPLFEVGNGTPGTASVYVPPVYSYSLYGFWSDTPDPHDPYTNTSSTYYVDPDSFDAFYTHGFSSDNYWYWNPPYVVVGSDPNGPHFDAIGGWHTDNIAAGYWTTGIDTVYSDALVVYKNGNAAVQGNLTAAGLTTSGTITASGTITVTGSGGFMTTAASVSTTDIPMFGQ